MVATARKQPLYDQLVDLLSEKIENEMSPGDMLPSERELASKYCLSRTTVRLAMSELEELGLVTRKHGKGTFVSSVSRETTDLTGAYSFTEQMRSLGRVPSTRNLDFEVREASKVYRMRRLRFADDVPLMIERTYVPVSLCEGLTLARMEGQSLYDIMEKDYHITIRCAQETFGARLVRPDEAKLLGIEEGSPVFRMVRTTYSSKNTVVEYTRTVARADEFEYRVMHMRG